MLNRDEILSDISILIEYRPDLVLKDLQGSGIDTSFVKTKKSLIDLVVDSLYDNSVFRYNISVTLSLFYSKQISLKTNDDVTFSNIVEELQNLFKSGDVDKGEIAKESAIRTGKATLTGTKTGGFVGTIVGFVVGATDSIFYASGQNKQAEAEKVSAKTALYKKLLTKEEPKNKWIPLAVVGGVLVAGGIVAFIMLKK